jgi:predicted RND superfamily exporter protein
MGIGVDYILYVVDRSRREVQRTGDMNQGIRQAIATSGMAVTFTATTMILGVAPWFLLSSLRFSAEMAVLQAVVLFIHWLAALTLAPALWAVWRPHFVIERGEPVPTYPRSEVRAEVAPYRGGVR